MLSNEKREYALTLAAILHDIGKVAQRYTPGKNHASLGQMFVNNLPNLDLDRDIKDLVSTLVGEHHLKDLNRSTLVVEDRELLAILQDADRKSASHDREDRDPEEFKDDPKMHNIYEYVSLSGDSTRRSSRSFNIVSVEKIADVKEGDDPLSFKDITYEKIWNDLTKEVSKISSRNHKEFFDSLDSILMNYLSFVPSAFYYSEPNITLYDHLRLTAAIALSEFRNRESGNNENLLLVMGEVSGIQRYIFNYVVSEAADDKATKRLRGRSFVIRLITDSVVSLLLDRLNLFRFNVMWEKSDGFFIVMNSSPENIEKLLRIREEVEAGLIEFNRGPSLAVSWSEMPLASLENLENESFRKALDLLVGKVSARKRRMLDSQLGSKWEDISDVAKPSGRVCRFCGHSQVTKNDRCELCQVEEVIGEVLVRDGKILMRNDDGGRLKLRYGSTVYSYDLTKETADGSSEVILVNSFDHSDFRHGARTILQGNFSPSADNGNSVKPLNELLCNSRVSGERCLYLGLAKTDVDNMGLIVTEGIDRLTLSRYASLSGLTSIFFSAIVNLIARKYNVYIIYSGGDDVTAIGEATSVLDFSVAVRHAFSQWVHNDEITLSTGIALTSHSFPVRRGMEIASDNLDAAKKGKKDALGMFDLVIPWKDIGKLTNVSTQIVKLVSDKENNGSRLGRRFPMILLDLDRENPYSGNTFGMPGKTARRNVKIRIPDSYIFYYLKRNLDRSDEKEVKRLTSLIADKDVFSRIRFVANNAIVNMRREEYGKQEN